jgi:hypothetical protein
VIRIGWRSRSSSDSSSVAWRLRVVTSSLRIK